MSQARHQDSATTRDGNDGGDVESGDGTPIERPLPADGLTLLVTGVTRRYAA
jgi:hypothetical protein